MARIFNTSSAAKPTEEELDPKGFSSLQLAIGFCAIGALGALFVAPMMADGAARIGILADSSDGIDDTVVGSIDRDQPTAAPRISNTEGRSYTIRQSVLQSSPSAECIIYDDGGQEGDC
ncbi:MAG: hypothetical protein AAF903_01465 [Pseudomonadota bacterium]